MARNYFVELMWTNGSKDDAMDYTTFFEHDVGVERLKWKGSQGIGLCPLPSHNDRNPSFSCCCETSRWKCFGCGESGNAYTLAKILCFNNPQQYLSDYSPVVKNGHNKAINPPEMDVDKVSAIKEKQARYISQLPDDIKDKLDSGEHLGMDDSGRMTFHYPNGIKHHKGKNGEAPYWEGDGSCKIFMEERLANYPAEKPLYIFEGEKDALVSPFNGISFSGGAGSIPVDISRLYVFDIIYIAYDNDDSGRDGAKKLAERIKKEAPHIKVFIIQWDKSLPTGYDIWDEWVKTWEKQNYHYDELDKAVVNATEFKLELPTTIGAFTVLTGKRASATTPPPTEWLIKGVLPKRFNSVIAGTTGSKKSMYAMQLGMSLANGEKEFCGNKIIPKRTNVLYVDTEIGEYGVHRRYKNIMRNMNWSGDEYFNAIAKGGSVMDVWGMVHEAYQYFRPELIIFDSLYNSTSCDDFSRAGQIQKVTNALTEFKERHGISVLAVHHFNKGGNEMGLDIDRMSGAAQLKNWLEWCMLLIKTNVKDFNLWQVAKVRDFDHDESVIGLKWNDFWFKTEGVIDDYKPFLINEEKKNKWQSVLEDCPEQFDTQSWLNVFSSKYPTMTERTGKQWLKECSESPMANKLSHGLYKKNLRLITESDMDEL